jgi:hypothetical protein
MRIVFVCLVTVVATRAAIAVRAELAVRAMHRDLAFSFFRAVDLVA